MFARFFKPSLASACELHTQHANNQIHLLSPFARAPVAVRWMMARQRRIATAIFWCNALAMLVIGLAFLTADRFFPFHGEVIQVAWSDLEPSYQTLYLGMMRTEGAGYLATALAMAILLLIPFRQNARWATWAIVSIGIVEHLPTFLATFHVARTTTASPPWIVTGLLMASLVCGLSIALQRSDSHS